MFEYFYIGMEYKAERYTLVLDMVYTQFNGSRSETF